MKKYLSLLLALCLTLSLAACGGKTDTNADTGRRFPDAGQRLHGSPRR